MLIKQLEELIPEYRDYSYNKGLAEESVDMRILYITKFIEFMEKDYLNPPTKIEYINDEHVFTYLDWKEQQGVSIYSIDNYFKNIKYFFDFMFDEKNMKNPVLRNVPSPLVNREKYDRQYDFFTGEEMQKIIDTARYEKDTKQDFFSFRNYTIITLISYAGLTLKELRNLKDNDINLEAKSITIRNKGERSIYLNATMRGILYAYIKLKNEKYKSNYLFPSRQNQLISEKAVQELVKNIIKKSDIESNGRELSPSTLRHSVIKMMVESKWDLPVISSICGLKQRSLHKYIALYTCDSEMKELYYLDNHPFIK